MMFPGSAVIYKRMLLYIMKKEVLPFYWLGKVLLELYANEVGGL